MTRKTKISLLIITIYFIAFFLFELFIGTARTLEYMEECVELERFNVLAPLVTHIEAGIWYFICVSSDRNESVKLTNDMKQSDSVRKHRNNNAKPYFYRVWHLNYKEECA